MNYLQKTLSILLLIPTILVKLTLFFLIVSLLVLLYRHQQKALQQRVFLWVLGSAVCCSLLWNVQHQFLKKKRAFVVKESVCVYAGPEKSFHKIFQLKLGTSVQLLNTKQSMSQILIDGQSGWVVSDQIEVV